MPEYFPAYYPPLERSYHGYLQQIPMERTRLEEPIFPIKELGTTIPMWDPANRFPTIIQHAQAMIRAGVGRLQIVLTPGELGRPRYPGKEMTEQIKELALANDAMFVGVEMPTTVNNVTGLTRGGFSDEVKESQLREIKEAIRWVGEACSGGQVDIVSMEFPRSAALAPWNKEVEGKSQFQSYAQEREEATIPFIDAKTGLPIASLELGKTLISTDPITGAELAQPEVLTFEKFKEFAKALAEKKGIDFETVPQEKKHDLFLETAQSILNSTIQRGKSLAEIEARRIETLFRDEWKTKFRGETEIKELNGNIENFSIKDFFENKEKFKEKEKQDLIDVFYRAWQAQQIKMKEQDVLLEKGRLLPLENFAKRRAVESYAELGITAMDETHRRALKRDIFVGPELGGPYSWGGHPDEWLQLIREARKEMVKRLVEERGIDEATAKELAQKHIKGTFDTSHLGMWLQKFRPDLPYEERLKEFKKWYLEQAEKIAKADEKEKLVGTIQLVDSATSEHGHLPPGQGIFPVVEAGKIFAKHGFSGFVVSEGHEEERFGEGRIFLKAWEAFGGQVPAGYFMGPPRRWADVHQGYFGKTYVPVMMTGAYTLPFMGYQPWSDLPFE